jgi:LPXTG-motif cell wall-anchored protein
MNPWPFVIAAYALTLGGAALIAGWAWFAMRKAERAVEDLRQQ